MDYRCKYCLALAEHCGFGDMGVAHSYQCPRYDGDHLDKFSRKEELPEWVIECASHGEQCND